VSPRPKLKKEPDGLSKARTLMSLGRVPGTRRSEEMNLKIDERWMMIIKSCVSTNNANR